VSDHAKAAGYYTAILEEIKAPTTHRLTIEAFEVDPGTNLAECTFEHIMPTSGDEKRFVTKLVGRRQVTVGLWRIVPNA